LFKKGFGKAGEGGNNDPFVCHLFCYKKILEVVGGWFVVVDGALNPFLYVGVSPNKYPLDTPFQYLRGLTITVILTLRKNQLRNSL
jgi:hypothetical protein